jgi:hypothetical protein
MFRAACTTALVAMVVLGNLTFANGGDGKQPPAGPPFNRSSYFAVKPDGQLLVIDGRVYCWRSANARARPKDVWHVNLPVLPASHHAMRVLCIGGETSLESWRNGREEYSLKLYVGKEDSNEVLFLTTDAEARAITVRQPKERFLWRVDKDADRWRESRTDPDDLISVFTFRNVAGPPTADFLGLAEKPLIIKDQQGNDQEFFPLVLVDLNHAAHFAYNDFSGK